MIKARKRGNSYHADYMIGRVHVVRGSLGTHNGDAAANLVRRIDVALSQGPSSPEWAKLCPVLPPNTYLRFANYIGVKENPLATWNELSQKFVEDMARQIKIHELAPNSVKNYERVRLLFERFNAQREIPIHLVREVDRSVAKEFKYWRIGEIQRKKGPDGGAGYATDASVMHRIFEYAIELNMITDNPFQFEPKVREPLGGAQPFKGEDLLRLREHAKNNPHDMLLFLVFRWTGLRVQDAVTLTWGEADLFAGQVNKRTMKSRYKKTAMIDLNEELLSALKAERANRNPPSSDTILVNPKPGHRLTKESVTYQVQKLGKRAGVEGVHPHRFRDTFAVDALLKGFPESSVARMLADTTDAVIHHYLPYVDALREQARNLINNGAGLEEYAESRRRHNGQHVTSGSDETAPDTPVNAIAREESELLPVSQ